MAKIAQMANQKAQTGRTRFLTESERQEIEKLAYQFFQERSGAHGHDSEDWFRAETVVRSRRS